MDQRHFIFSDSKGRRWRRINLLMVLLLLVLTAAFIVFVRALLVLPQLSHGDGDLRTYLRALAKGPERVSVSEHPPKWLQAGTKKPPRPARPARTPGEPIVLGYHVAWDANSLTSLKAHAKPLTHVAPEWLHLSGVPPKLRFTPEPEVLQLAAEQPEFVLMPLLTNLNGNAWQPEAVETLLRATKGRQRRFFHQLITKLSSAGAGGVIVDFEGVDPTYQPQFTALLQKLARALHRSRMQLWLAVPVGNDIKLFDLDNLALRVDRFVAMLYDETGETDEPGPIASQGWFEEWLSVLLQHGAPEQWIIGMGTFGYDWEQGARLARSISFADAMARANYAGQGPIEDKELLGPHFSYTEKGREHTVWFLDTISFHNQQQAALRGGVGGIALHRLGTEDPDVWRALACGGACRPEEFTAIPSLDTIAHIGEGDFVSASNERGDGSRAIAAGERGTWLAAYQRYPKYPMLYHWGDDAGSKVALTFDDGPSAEWTPQILDVLKREGVQATFFIQGKYAAEYPKLIERIAAEGHEIGNHSYTHPDLSQISEARATMELNATQRIVQSLTGYSTLLFRPPYNSDRHPAAYKDFLPIQLAHDLGYIVVSYSIDTEDWDLAPPETLVERVRERRGDGNVVLLHDAGGDRSRTIAALPRIIDYLRKRGDTIVPLNELGGMTKDRVMPPVTEEATAPDRFVVGTGLRLFQVLQDLCGVFLIVSGALVLLRTLILIALSLWHRWHERPSDAQPSGTALAVSVLLPAHNEAKVIGQTIESVLDTQYGGALEVIVVDDGSQDATAAVVAQAAARDPRVRLIRQEKRGKAAALNTALRAARSDILVMLDADTLFQPDTIPHLLTQFSDPRVAAVSGHAKVGNRRSWIARFQSLEYICGFNLDRRAYHVLNCITVVPGAVSAYRRDAVLAAGGLPEETLAEDTDLTYVLHRAKHRICYASGALAWTEAPAGVRSFLRQRRRWAFGTLQCLWKHRSMLFNPRYGALAFFSMPSVWFFHMFLVALVPLVDLLLLISLFTGGSEKVAVYAAIFLLLDLLTAFAACWIDREPLKTSWLIIPMRLLYRPLLAFCVWYSGILALRGVFVEWGRQDRRGLAAPGSQTLLSASQEKA